MHLVLVNSNFPPRSLGGIATYNALFAAQAARTGHAVTVVTTRAHADEPVRTDQDGVTVWHMSAPNMYGWGRRLRPAGGLLRAVDALGFSLGVNGMLRIIGAEQPIDIVEYADAEAEGVLHDERLSRRWLVRCHTPLAVLAQSSAQTLPYQPGPLTWLERRMLRHAYAWTAPSHAMARTVASLTGVPSARIQVVPNLLDVTRFSPPATPPRATPLHVLFVGRLEAAKGALVLEAALPALCNALPEAVFTLVGHDRRAPDGPSMCARLERTLALWCARGQVVLAGHVTPQALVDHYHWAHIALVPSVAYESFSYTAAQAMACGLPVVASAVGGIPETLDHGRAGVLVPPGNADALAEAVVALAHDLPRRIALGHQARAHALATFSPVAVTTQMLDVYQALLSAPRPLRGTQGG